MIAEPVYSPIKHDKSKYLKDFEIDKIINFIDASNGIVIASAIIQLYLTKIPENTVWYKKTTGILCLIKDYSIKSFYFRLINLKPQLLWEEELYTNFSFNKITKNFCCFPGRYCNVGFNFAFEDELYKLQRAIDQASNSLERFDPNNNTSHRLTINLNYVKRDSNKKADKKIIDKNLIGNPTHFVHVNHIGISQDNSFNILLNDKNEHVKMIIDVLNQLHIKPNKDAVEYADNYIKSNGGYGKYFNGYQSLKENMPRGESKSKSDIPKKKPKVQVSRDLLKNELKKQNNKVIINISTTPNTLKPPSRPAPKPPIGKNEQCRHSIPGCATVVDFLSPISNSAKYESDGSNFATPEFITDENGKNFQTRKTSSAISQAENRNELLKSIENFKGGLKHVTPSKNLQTSKREENDPMSQLIKALNAMRPYLNVSSDESDTENSFSF
ncbi:neural Wiskott-Aldrich syndrome [Brachionus plicatilis]|uniref:Neural Wiskott-Aldrich syndrome n=1 Tax=Brachionus plicatilis TaxID=10195 RepID=A0A3M7RZK9_BRAPC|nr:neural Wiskott-Aldrich syndrome [Brachionus plicatilis]